MSRGIVFGFQYFFLDRLNGTSQEKIFGAALGLYGVWEKIIRS